MSSDDFATILRLFVGRNYDYWLQLFQPERYDYCSPLLAIGRQPEKRCGGSRQWFRAPAAGLPRRVEGARPPATRRDRSQDLAGVILYGVGKALASDPHTVGADPAGLAWSALLYTLL